MRRNNYQNNCGCIDTPINLGNNFTINRADTITVGKTVSVDSSVQAKVVDKKIRQITF